MATEVTYNGDGSDTTFDITFPFLKSTDVKVQVGGTTKNTPSDFTISGTVVTFTTAPPSGTGNVRIYRNTGKDIAKATFNAGSSIKAEDLNNNVLQALYSLQEIGTVTSNDEGLGLTAGSKGDVHVNSGTDWYIKDDAIDSNMLNTNSVTSDAIASGAVTTEHYVAGSVNNAAIGTNAVNSDQIANQAITQAKINNAVIFTPVGTVIWYAGSTAPTGYLKCNGDAIANGSGTTQSITADFSTLYAVVGANLPDLRGEFIRGWDDGKGTDSGRNIRSSQSDQNKIHNHNATSSSSSTTATTSITGTFGNDPHSYTPTGVFSQTGSNFGEDQDQGNNGQIVSLNASHDHNTTTTTTTTIANDGGESRPRNIALLACIKY